MVQKFTRALLLTSCIVAPGLSAQTALAQEGDAEKREITIVVTALKQGYSVLDTAATVAVVDDEAVSALNITSANDLGGIIPGYITMQGVAGASNTFRGLGSNSADPSIESSVATFNDGVYFGHSRDLVTPLYDLEDIQFIPGTQATLLGKNSSLGAVSITSRKPGDVFAYNGSASYITELQGTKVEAGVDIPLGERFSARVAGFWNDEDAYGYNNFLDRSERQLTQTSGRFILDGEFGDTGELTVLYQHDDRDAKGHYLEIVSDPNFEIRGLGDALGQSDLDAAPNDIHSSGSESLGFPGDISGPGQFDTQTGDRATLIASAEIGGGHTLTAQTGYASWESERVTDLDFTQFRIIDLLDDETNDIFSQELRISSDVQGRLTYLAGLYYYHNDYFLGRDVLAQAEPVIGFRGLSDSSTDIETESWSVFTSGRYELSTRWALSGGLRYTDEEKTATYERTTTDTIGFVLGAPLPLTTLPSQTSTEIDGNIGIEFMPNDNSLIYVTYARGSKSGGFQSTPDTFQAASFDGEVAYTTELGAKFGLGSDAWASVALFDTIVEDFQVGRVENLNGFPQIIIDNSEIRSKGFEGAFNWNVQDNITLDGSVIYSDAKFTEDFFSDDGAGGQVLEAFEGMRLPRAPEWSARIGADYRKDIGKNLTLMAGGSLRYTSERDLQLRASNPLAPRAKANTLVDARISIGASDDRWRVSLIGNNLTDERFVTFASDAPLAPSGEAYYGILNRPQTIALQLSISG